MMKKFLLTACLAASFFAAKSQQEIQYEVSFPNAVHHEAEISMLIPNVTPGKLKVRMSRSSPGRYATHEFGKNVYNFKAFDGNGKTLTFKKPEGDVYEIATTSKTVKVTYTLFGNWVDGTYVAFDDTHAHIMVPATFAYPVGMDARPRTVRFNYAQYPDWKIATQLKPMPKDVYYAPNFQYFMDSPIEITNYKTASFEVTDKYKTQTIHLITHSDDNQKTIDDFAKKLEVMVYEQALVWGELPKFDYGNYYFLHDVHPEYAGDGMEHRNSTTIVQRTPKIEGYESQLLGTFSHEFFHSWNVERLRPKTLQPFKFDHSNVSDGLWLAEGFTQYYGNLILKRTNFRTEENAYNTFNGIISAVLTMPGAKNFSPIDASQYAVFADAGVAVDQTNQQNIFTSYYTYGAAVALALDLTLRSEFKLTLDDYMKALWQAYGKPEIAYTMQDLQKTLGLLTKNQAFATAFFKNYVFGTNKPDYAKLLLNAGLILRKANSGKAYAGFGRVSFEKDKAIMPQTLQGTPAYASGLDFGCVLTSIDGKEIKSLEDINKITEAHKPGDVIEIKYSYHGINKSTKLTFMENPSLEIVAIETTGGNLTTEMKNFRADWLASKIRITKK